MMQRRAFLTGLAAFIGAPAIVRAGSLMPVKQMIERVSMRELATYCPAGDQPMYRLDVLFTRYYARPEWAAFEHSVYDMVVRQSEQFPCPLLGVAA